MKNKEKEKADFLEKLKGMTIEEVIAYDGPSPLDRINIQGSYFLNSGKYTKITFIKALNIALRLEGATSELMEYLKAMAYKEESQDNEAKIGDSVLGEFGTVLNSYLIDINDFSVKKLN